MARGVAAAPTMPSLQHGLLYCISSLVLGVELNIIGPTVASLAAQVHSSESSLGPVVGLGGIGLLLGGLPAGWLLDKLPGHIVIAAALALQSLSFLLLPHCAHLAVLATVYCAAALTFNAITTGANALILWRYPASHGAWLNLASALFGVGCFLAPVLADLAARIHNGGGGGGGPAATIGPFALESGAASLAYYLVAAGAACCCLWASLLPSPPRPSAPEDHPHDSRQQQQHYSRKQQRQRHHPQLEGGDSSGGSGGSGGSSSPLLCRSPSFSSVLDMGGVDSRASGDWTIAPGGGAAGPDAATAATPGGGGNGGGGGGNGGGSGGAEWGSASSANLDDVAAATAAAGRAKATASAGSGGGNVTADGAASGTSSSDDDGGACGGAPLTVGGSGAPDQDDRPYHHQRHGDLGGGAGGGGSTDILSVAAAQIKSMQAKDISKPQSRSQSQTHSLTHSQQHSPSHPHQHQRRHHCDRNPSTAALPPTAVSYAAVAARMEAEAKWRSGSGAGGSGGCGGGGSGSAALFRRYLRELRMGWPVLAPVVVLLFANISTQASFGAWVTTYCRLAAGLDEAGAQAVTAAYWAAFTGTRLAGVAAAPFLHASSVLLLTSPFAVAGAGLAVTGLPAFLFPAAPSAAAAAAAAAAGAPAFAAGLPLWALYTVVCLVGVGCATGFANTVSLTGDHLQLDGFTNGILSSVAGLASTLCPAAVPWLAEHTGMGYGALMVVALAMSVLQLASVGAALLGATWVDAWQRAEKEEAAKEAEAAEAEAVEEGRGQGGEGRRGGRGRHAASEGELAAPLLMQAGGGGGGAGDC